MTVPLRRAAKPLWMNFHCSVVWLALVWMLPVEPGGSALLLNVERFDADQSPLEAVAVSQTASVSLLCSPLPFARSDNTVIAQCRLEPYMYLTKLYFVSICFALRSVWSTRVLMLVRVGYPHGLRLGEPAADRRLSLASESTLSPVGTRRGLSIRPRYLIKLDTFAYGSPIQWPA